MNRKQDRLVYAFCAAGFLMRAGYSLFSWDGLVFPDEDRFWIEANNLVESGTLIWKDEYAHDMPVTALLIAFFLKVTGSGVLGVRLLFSAISAMTIYLISRMAGILSENPRVPVVAAAVSAFYPFFIYYSSLILSETIFLFAVTAYFLFLLRRGRGDCWKAGILGGFAHLTRPSLYYFYPVVFFLQAIILRSSWRRATITILLTAAVVLPWAVRNYNVFGTFVPGTTGAGQVLWEGNNPLNNTGGTSDSFEAGSDYLSEMPKGLDERERDSWKKERAFDYIKNNPEVFLQNCVKKFIRFWNLWPNHPSFSNPIYKYLSLLSFGPVLLGSIAGLWLLRNRWRELMVLWLFISYYTVLHMVSIGSIRYRLPLEPLLIVLASCSYVRIHEIVLEWTNNKPGKRK